MKTWKVDDSGRGDFSTVKEAVAAASAGDTIDITGGNDGVHKETDILVGKDLTITSTTNATIDGEDKGRIFTIDDGNADNQLDVTINNMVLTGGKADDGTSDDTDANSGGAIFNKENLTIDNIKATENFSNRFGGAIASEDGNIVISQSVFYKNSSDRSGGAISSEDGNIVISQSVFDNNTAGTSNLNSESGGFAGAILLQDGSLDIKESTFTDNVASRVGGAVAALDSTLTMEQSSLRGNSAGITGGAISNFASQATFTEISIDGNSAQFGGGIQSNLENAETTVVRSNITNNSAFLTGGGVHNMRGSQFNAIETSIEGNKLVNEFPNQDIVNTEPRGAKFGGGIYNVDGSVSLTNSNVRNNQADFAAGISSNSNLDIQNSEVANNTVTVSGLDFLDPNILEVQNEIGFLGTQTQLEIEQPQVLTGTPENDSLTGSTGNDTLNGGAGVNIYYGDPLNSTPDTESSIDTFVLSPDSFNIIQDFTDGQDFIALKGGISFNDLSFSDSIISFNDKPIAFLDRVDTTALTSEDFVTL